MIASASILVSSAAYSQHHFEPAVEVSIMGSSVYPGTNFYRYANGTWLETTEVPADRRSLSGANAAALDTGVVLNEIINDAAASNPAQETPAWRVATLYRAYHSADGASLSAQENVRAGLDEIRSLATHYDVARFMADPFSNSIVGAYVWIDAGNPSRREITIDQEIYHQGAVGLRNKEAYLAEDKAELREAYREYVTGVFEKLGYSSSADRADAIIAFETALADGMWDQAQMRDRTLNYSPMTFEALQDYAPGFEWRGFLDAMGASNPQNVILRQDTGVREAARIFGETPVEVLKDYLAFHWVDNH
ncbi:hypothetical protein B5C34_06330 [Pacificimonas flava]|uniref:Peptidase M13 N-terminal domain-containing protein n=2 Tax=Pacificimonas TaxID=1960290 RepID=A0A219B5P0_9SPHN|nr:hypothetical protein B5C34_06330 [Pacificimonas flava]